MRANLTLKMKIIREYQTERKDRKLIELACTQLNRPSDQLIANHGEFQALCDDHEELQEAGTWLLESQELVKELMCRTVEYGEVKTRTSGMDSNAHIKPKTPKVRRKRTPGGGGVLAEKLGRGVRPASQNYLQFAYYKVGHKCILFTICVFQFINK